MTALLGGLQVFPLAVAGSVWGDTGPVAGDSKGELLRRIDQMGHLAADFTQTQYGPNGELQQESSGLVRLLPPRFRWEVVAPFPQVVIATEHDLRVYDPDLEQVIVRPLREALAETPLALLTHTDATLHEDYDVRRLRAGEFMLRPRKDSALISEVVLNFAHGTLQGIAIRDPLGYRADIVFSGFRDASVIQSADFKLRLPPGVEVY